MLFWKAERITSDAKKFLPSIGTIMICSLSESRSAMIFWMSMGFCLRTAASNFMRSASAAAVTRMRLASASERLLLALDFGFAVNDLGLRGGFGVLQRGFLASFGFQLGLLDLLLLQGQGVLHGVGFGLGLQDADLGLRFGLLDVARFLGVGFEFGDFHFLALDFLFGAEALVLLFLQEEAFEALGVFGGKLNVAEKHFADDDAVAGEARLDGVGGLLRNSSRLTAKISRVT